LFLAATGTGSLLANVVTPPAVRRWGRYATANGALAVAAAVEAAYGVHVAVVTIGPAGCDALDIYADWYFQSEVEEDGCVLVRPDNFVAWRARTAADDASATLVEVFGRLLGRADNVARKSLTAVAAE